MRPSQLDRNDAENFRAVTTVSLSAPARHGERAHPARRQLGEGAPQVVHKFKSGDLVEFETGFLQPRTASGVYTVVRALPASPDGHLQYQVKSDVEPYGRLALEHQLVRVSEPTQPLPSQPKRS
jgi:hypothetical protein